MQINHLSASVLRGVWETDSSDLPPIFNPLSACFSYEKSASSSSEDYFSSFATFSLN